MKELSQLRINVYLILLSSFQSILSLHPFSLQFKTFFLKKGITFSLPKGKQDFIFKTTKLTESKE